MIKLQCTLIIVFLISLICCRKKEVPVPPSDPKYITSFVFTYADNSNTLKADVQGVITNDTILITITAGPSVANLIPRIIFYGKSIFPSNQTAQDFTHPVKYTVTANDGSIKTYTVIVKPVSGTKQITSFILYSNLNPGLSKDVRGVITGDTILLNVSPDVKLDNLVPTITHTGITVSPRSLASQNFNMPVTYTVTAEDAGTHSYKIISSVNATVYVGSSDGYLYALYAATGTVKWKVSAGNQVVSPSYHEGNVFFGTTNGAFYAVDAETGSVKWKFYKYAGAYTGATIHDGKVYFGFVSYMYKDTYLFAVNETNGNLIFETLINDAPYSLALGNPTVAYGAVYITDSNIGLIQYDAVTGQRKMAYFLGIGNLNPAFADNIAYVGIEGVLMIAIDINTGITRWSRSTAIPGWNGSGFPPPNLYSSATIVNDVIYVGCRDYMCALNRADGSIKWYTPIQGYFSSPVAGNGMVYVGQQDKRIYAFDAATGSLKWKFDDVISNTANIPNPVFANGIVYAHRADNSLYALDGITGNVKWKFQAPAGVINTDPCVLDGRENIFYPGSSGDHN